MRSNQIVPSSARSSLLKAGILSLALVSVTIRAHAAEPKVIVTIKPVHSLVAQIMDSVAEPVLLVSGSSSPHTFTLKPSDARSINKADVFIRVSESVEPFTQKIVKSLPQGVKLVSLDKVSGIKLLQRRTGTTFEAHDHGDHDHSDHGHDEHSQDARHDEHDDAAGQLDGHIWLDPQNAKAMAEAVTKALGERFPQHIEKFKANAFALIGRLDALNADIDKQLQPVRGKPFVVFHDAYQYFEKRFGIEAVGSVTMSPDVQPSAKRLSDLRQKISTLSAACVFAEPGFKPQLVSAITEGTSAKSGTLDPEGLALEPGKQLYEGLIRGLAKNIKDCLSATS